MNFGELLHVAQKNNTIQKTGTSNKSYYSTKYEPPKKESKEKKLSANIKRFLEKQEEEKREQERIAKQNFEQLHAMRDEKAKNKIKKMLKVTKSANRSVLADAIDHENTAYTLEGPEQPDQDDYGYTSKEASQLYSNLMNKYKATPEVNLFAKSNKPSSKVDLSSTKDRVRAALVREKEEANLPHRRQRSSLATSSEPTENNNEKIRQKKNLYDPQSERDAEEQKRKEMESNRAKFKKPSAPPPLDFRQILKLAEQKQFEPITVEIETKKKEPERLLTNKEKLELEQRNAYLAERKIRKSGIQPDKSIITNDSRQSKVEPSSSSTRSESNKVINNPSGRIPKLNGYQTKPKDTPPPPASAPKRITPADTRNGNSNGNQKYSINKQSAYKSNVDEQNTINKSATNNKSVSSMHGAPPSSSSSSASSSDKYKHNSSNRTSNGHSNSRKNSELFNEKPLPPKKHDNSYQISKSQSTSGRLNQTDIMKKSTNTNNQITKENNKQPTGQYRSNDKGSGSSHSKLSTTPTNHQRISEQSGKSRPPADLQKTRQFPPTDVKKTRPFPPADVQKTRQFPPADLQKTRQFPSADGQKTRQFPPNDLQQTRRFPPDNERNVNRSKKSQPPPSKRRRIDSDSEYDSEMDDFIDDEGEDEDFSSHIKEIFGYDRNRYRDIDDNDDNMESSYAQVMREEFVSKKIGMLEDLEDIRLEAEEKKRKKNKK